MCRRLGDASLCNESRFTSFGRRIRFYFILGRGSKVLKVCIGEALKLLSGLNGLFYLQLLCLLITILTNLFVWLAFALPFNRDFLLLRRRYLSIFLFKFLLPTLLLAQLGSSFRVCTSRCAKVCLQFLICFHFQPYFAFDTISILIFHLFS